MTATKRLPSPFAAVPPDEAWAAALELQAALGERTDLGALAEPGRGKMFGVLVAEDAATGDRRVLHAFSGMLGGKWHVDGFAPPLFRREAYERVWPEAERVLRGYEAALAAEADGARRVLLEAERASRSHAWWAEILETYELRNARGASTTVRALYAPEPVPGGAGDCAGPKLLAEAYRRGLAPRGFAEFWWGAPPLTGGRVHGAPYPACRRKCGRVLPWMLEGLDVDEAPEDPDAVGEVRVVWEDASLLVVDKPAGLPTVPGRFRKERDSVERRTGGTALHELDAEASGLVVVARDPATAVALHRSFARDELEVVHAAWLDGAVVGEAGTIDLALRLDRDDRPRRVVDAARGKRAVTGWLVRRRGPDGRTLVELTPRTDRTHQLRVHAAVALGAPIVGDALYGDAASDAPLALRAERVRFRHPATGAAVEVALSEPW